MNGSTTTTTVQRNHGMPGATGTARKDLKLLERVAPPPGTLPMPAASLNVSQLYEVERMAAQGMNLAQIGIRLRIPADVWAQYIAQNAQLDEAYQAGLARGVDIASGTILRGAEAGDIGAARYYLDRLGGPQFKPPQQQQGPSVVVQTGAVLVQPGSVSAAMEKQRAVLDVQFEELDPST